MYAKRLVPIHDAKDSPITGKQKKTIIPAIKKIIIVKNMVIPVVIILKRHVFLKRVWIISALLYGLEIRDFLLLFVEWRNIVLALIYMIRLY